MTRSWTHVNNRAVRRLGRCSMNVKRAAGATEAAETAGSPAPARQAPASEERGTQDRGAQDRGGVDQWRMYRAFDLLRALHQNFYDQAKTADQKAGFICTFLTILFAWSKEQGNVLLFLTYSPSWSLAWILSVVFACAAAFSMPCTVLVILPRVTTTDTSSMYWGSWINGGIKIEQLVAETLDEFIMTEYLKDIKNLARICRAKYRFVRLAFRGTAATILFYLTLLILR